MEVSQGVQDGLHVLAVEAGLVGEVIVAVGQQVLQDEDVVGAAAVVVAVHQPVWRGGRSTNWPHQQVFTYKIDPHFGMGSLKKPWQLESRKVLSLGRTSLSMAASRTLTLLN